MEIPTIDEILASMEDFLKRHDMAVTRFGRDATGEPQLIDSIRGGRVPNLATLQRIAEFMKLKDAELAAAHATGDTGSAAASSSGTSVNISADQVPA